VAKLDWEHARRRDLERKPPKETTTNAWWIVPASGSPCGECGMPVPKGDWLAFRSHDRHTACHACAERLGIFAQPSRRWLAHRRRHRAS
jgi:hypothetical protein